MTTTAEYTDSLRKKSLLVVSILIFLTFIMIILGGIVKNSGSSLACPDWPLCFGEVMPTMEGGVAIEHSHRLLGTLIGVFTCLLSLLASRMRKQQNFLFKLSIAALVFVIVQGILGGATVLSKISPLFSSFHLLISHLFFGILLWIYFTIRSLNLKNITKNFKAPAKLKKIALIASALVIIQITLGAIIRHFGAGPACGVGWSNIFLCQELTTGEFTLWPMNGPGQLHMLHRLNGYLTLFALIGLTIPLLKFARLHHWKSMRKQLISIHIVVLLQVLLGMKVIGTGIGFLAVTLHLAFGLLLWSLVISTYFRLTQLDKGHS